jgi:hypothetical protein
MSLKAPIAIIRIDVERFIAGSKSAVQYSVVLFKVRRAAPSGVSLTYEPQSVNVHTVLQVVITRNFTFLASTSTNLSTALSSAAKSWYCASSLCFSCFTCACVASVF